MLGAELDPAQSTGCVLGDQLLDLGPAPPVPCHAHLLFIHALTSSSISLK
jgi:hypothetical protein